MSIPHLDFTGERMIPDTNHGAAFYYEHITRYLFAAQFCEDKTVLDVGSGAGYGSLLLAKRGRAKKVWATDISRESVTYAKERYPHAKINFIVGAAEHVKKVKNSSIDVSTCFEVIEHVTDQEVVIEEQKRVLKKDGIFIVSTPNKLTYPDGNEFHVNELYPEEFRKLLKKYFKYVTFFYQGFELSQILKPETKKDDWILGENYSVFSTKTHTPAHTEDNSQYIVAVCSDVPLPAFSPYVLNQSQVDFYDLTKGLLSLGDQYSKLFQQQGSSTPTKVIQSHFDDSSNYLRKHRADLLLHLDRIRNSKFYFLWRKYVALKERVLEKMNIIRYFRLFMTTKMQMPWISAVKESVPIGMRKKMRRVISRLFPVAISDELVVSDKIQKEWNSWKTQRKPGSTDIFIFSVIGYNYRHQRPQHLATQLVEHGHRVFYVENEFSLSEMKIDRVSENLYKVTMPCSENLFIYQDIPNNFHLKIWQQAFQRLAYQADIINPLAKIDHPFWYPLVDFLELPFFYDCMDKHSGFSENSSGVLDFEDVAIQDARFVLASSSLLKTELSAKTSKPVYLLPNAGDFEHFKKGERAEAQSPKVVGYFGAIAEWFDTKLFEKLLLTYPDVSFQLIGRVTNPEIEQLVQKYQNLILFDEIPYLALPEYLSHFDVCIIPFEINDLIKATSPVKVYEYLAAGKAIVTTAMPEIQSLSDVLYYSDGHKAFIENLDLALKEKTTKALIKKRQKVAQENTWLKRGDQLQEIIDESVFPLVSVIILSYNSLELIKECVRSLLHQSHYPHLELVIVDNNSNDETKKYLRSLKKEKNISIIFNKKNEGFSKGNNIGMAAAKGEYLVLLNNDTVVTPGWASRMVHYCSDSSVGLVGPVTNSIGNEAKVDIGEYDPKDPFDLANTARMYTAHHWGETLDLSNLAAFCWMLSRKTYKDIGKLDEKFGQGMFEDDDYCKRVKNAGLHVLCADDVFVHHYGSVSFQKLASAEYQALFEKNKKIFEKKWSEQWVPHTYR